jgi:hypothetical protein
MGTPFIRNKPSKRRENAKLAKNFAQKNKKKKNKKKWETADGDNLPVMLLGDQPPKPPVSL